MKKVQLILLSSLIFLIVSCSHDKNEGHLTGKLENAPEAATLFLADWESKTLFDSIQMTNGRIDYKFKIPHPKYFLLHNARNQYEFRDKKFIWLEPNDIKIKGDFNFMKNITLEGSTSQSEFENYNILVDNANKRINKLKGQIYFKNDEEKKIDTLKIESISKNLSDSIVDFMTNHTSSYVTLSLLHAESYLAFRHLNKKQIHNVYDKLLDELKKSEQGIEIKKYMELPEPPKIGDLAPEIIQVTPSGDTVRLSDFKGKYVLLDFWSSSCGPCRGQFKWLRKVYSKYSPKELEIIGVSGDYNKRNWIDAIKHDSIPWINISDLKGWKNEAFLVYDVKFIPDKFLVNPDGLIIKDRMLLGCEPTTDQILGEIFDKKNGL